MSHLTEQDLTPKPARVDFEIRRLDDYSYSSLDSLQTAVLLAASMKELSTRERLELDFWSYRIADAMKEIRKRKPTQP